MNEIFKVPPADQVKAEIERRRQEIIQLKRILKISRDAEHDQDDRRMCSQDGGGNGR